MEIDIMNINESKLKIGAGLVALLMVACAIPFVVADDSDALKGSTSDMALNVDSYPTF